RALGRRARAVRAAPRRARAGRPRGSGCPAGALSRHEILGAGAARRRAARPRRGCRGDRDPRPGRVARARRRDAHDPPRMSEPVNVADFEEIARERLDPGPSAYFAGGAGDGRTLRAHVQAADRGFTKELLAQVVEARFTALVLTVDFPVAGRRERDIRLAFTLPDDLPAPNLPVALARKDFHSALGHIVDATLTWRDLEWLRSACELPLVLKRVLTAADALLAAEHGASAIVLSNHGGRQLDGVPASLDALPGVVEAGGGRVAGP